MKQDRKEQILSKYLGLTGFEIRKLPFGTVLLGYRSVIKPYPFRTFCPVESIIDKRAMCKQVDAAMANCIKILRADPTLKSLQNK